MRVTARRSAQGTRGRSRLLTWLTALSIGGALAPGGCSVDRDDHYELLRRREDRVAGEPTPLRYAAGDDASAARVRRLMSDELSGELLRTFAMARRLVAETAPAFVGAARASRGARRIWRWVRATSIEGCLTAIACSAPASVSARSRPTCRSSGSTTSPSTPRSGSCWRRSCRRRKPARRTRPCATRSCSIRSRAASATRS